MATPTCVQHVYFQSNENLENGNAFKYPLPAPTLAGNCLVLFLHYAFSAGRTVTVTDNNGNTWPAVTVKTDDTGNGVTSACYVFPNVGAGVSTITVTFDAALQGMVFSFSEWFNVATASAVDVSIAANTVLNPNIASGSITTTVDGDLILHWGIDTNFGVQLNGGRLDGITNLAKNSGYTLLQCDSRYAEFLEHQVQGTHGATNPTVVTTGPAPSTCSFNSITVALKSASSGTAPNASDMRIFGIHHTRQETPAGTTANYSMQHPTFGNLSVLSSAYSELQEQLNSVSGSVSGSWTVLTGSNDPQLAYKTSSSPSDGEVLTLNIHELGSGNLQMLLYDVVNGGAFDKVAYNNGGSFGPGTVNDAPDITPGISSGIAIGTIGLLTGPPDTVGPPTGSVFDAMFYTGYTDLSPADSGDGYAHLFFSSNAAQAWSWHDTAATTGWFAAVATFGQAISAGAQIGKLIYVMP